MFSLDDTHSRLILKRLAPKSQRAFRSLAFQVLYAVDRADYECSSDEVLDLYEQYFDLEVDKTSIAVQIINGVLLYREELDATLQPLVENWDYDRIACVTKLTLKMAAWELIYFKKTPAKTVLDEYVELSKGFDDQESYRFLNSVLEKVMAIHNINPNENDGFAVEVVA